MDYSSYQHITLNQKLYTKQEILELEVKEENHFSAVILFLKEWFSDSTEITVQTSGSTGTPKAISIPKQSFIESAKNTCDFLNLTSSISALLCIPVHYIGGKMMVIRGLVSGYNLTVIEPSSSPLADLINLPDFIAITPMQAQKSLAEYPKQFKQIDTVIIGGGAVSHSFSEQIKDFTTSIYSTYGMTETVSHIALKKLSGPDRSDYFDTFPPYSIESNEEDCLVINCPTLFPDTIITNDLVEIKEISFKWLGRKDNVINSGGIKISPEEVEAKLHSLLTDVNFYVSSKKDDLLGEKVVLVIENNSSIQLPMLNSDTFNPYEFPKEIIHISSFEYTDTGKIKRKRF